MGKEKNNWIHTFYDSKKSKILVVVAPRGENDKRKYKKYRWLGSTSGSTREIHIKNEASVYGW